MSRIGAYIKRVNAKLDKEPELPKGGARIGFLLDCAMARAFRHLSVDAYVYYYKRLKKPMCWRGLLDKKQSWAMWDLDTKDVVERLLDKAGCLKRYAAFVKRDWLWPKESGFEAFAAFAKAQGRYIVKPRTAGKGIGVHMGEYHSDADLRTEYDALCRDDCVVEQVIRQHPDMARLHPRSVNTVRIASVRTESGITLLSPCVRIGNGDVIDNFSNGGMLCQIDMNTGRVETDAVDKKHRVFAAHPVTGITFQGYQLPHWELLKETVRKAAMLDPDAIFIGWDMAITPDGVDLVELNDHQFFGWQDALGTNWRKAYLQADREARKYFARRQKERAKA